MPSLLNTAFTLTPRQQADYSESGFVILRNVIEEGYLQTIAPVIRAATRTYDRNTKPLEERDTYGKAFTQVHNLWRRDAQISELVLSPALGEVAARLLGCEGVRIYHDQALFKEPGGGRTPWHCDQFYWPLDTDKTITAWIPLQDTPHSMGPMAFATGSHTFTEGRELHIGDESERFLSKALRNYDVAQPSFCLGDVSFHSGWTFHHAGPNATDQVREAFTIIYMDKNARLTEPANAFERFDAKTWCRGIRPGEVVASEINPVVWPVTTK